jgi:hypothetical protein
MIAAGGTGDAGDILRGSSGKTNAVVFSAVQPHRLGVLKAALMALLPKNGYSRPRGAYRDGTGLQIALYTHRCQAGRTSSNRPGVEAPDYPASLSVSVS